MILITGATGTIGSKVLDRLIAGGEDVRAMTRDPARLRAYDGTAAVEIVIGDFDRPDSLRAAVDGVDAVFLLTAGGEAVPDHDRALIDVASRAGVGRVVKLSAIDLGVDTGPFEWHRPGEVALRESDLEWTALRPAGFASNALGWAETIRAGGPVPNMSGTGAQGIVDPRDVAEVAVAALLSAEHTGRTYTLTGPENLAVGDQVASISEELGRTVPVVDVPIEVAREQMLGSGMSASMVAMALQGAELLRSGGGRWVTDDVERVLGRPARTFATWVHDHRASFTG